MYVRVGHAMQYIYLCIHDIVSGTRTGTWDLHIVITSQKDCIYITSQKDYTYFTSHYLTEGLHLLYYIT